MDTGSFVFYIKTEDIYSDIAKDVKTSFNTSICELNRPLSKGKNKKVIKLRNDKGFKQKKMIQIGYILLTIYKVLTNLAKDNSWSNWSNWS